MPPSRSPRIVAAVASLAAVVLAGCGDDASSADRVVELAEQAADDLDVEIDAACVRDVVERLSDEDLDRLAAAGVDGDAELTPAGSSALDDLTDCFELPGG